MLSQLVVLHGALAASRNGLHSGATSTSSLIKVHQEAIDLHRVRSSMLPPRNLSA